MMEPVIKKSRAANKPPPAKADAPFIVFSANNEMVGKCALLPSPARGRGAGGEGKGAEDSGSVQPERYPLPAYGHPLPQVGEGMHLFCLSRTSLYSYFLNGKYYKKGAMGQCVIGVSPLYNRRWRVSAGGLPDVICRKLQTRTHELIYA